MRSEDLSVGSNDQNNPFFIWNPVKDTYKEKGGITDCCMVAGARTVRVIVK